MSSLLEQASIIITPNAYKEGKLYGLKGTDLDVVRATTATRVNAEGLIESVANNVPRLDYTNGSCPSILVEPQRTNLLLRSEEFDNAVYTLTRVSAFGSGSVANTTETLDPSGNNNADLLQQAVGENSSGGAFQFFSAVLGTTYTISVFAKTKNQRYLRLGSGIGLAGAAVFCGFDLQTGEIGTPDSGVSASITQLNNGWYRCSVTITSQITGSRGVFFYQSANLNSAVTTPLSSLYLYGAQLEAGSNATSYIPTVASAVTRNADVISKTGIADLIGQSEGTLFTHLNFKRTNISAKYISINNGTNNNRINFVLQGNGNLLILEITINGIVLANVGLKSLSNLNLFLKIALKYKSGEIKCFVDGQLLFSNALTYSNAVFDRLLLSNTTGGQRFDGDINSIQVYKTALTDQECINLTTL